MKTYIFNLHDRDHNGWYISLHKNYTFIELGPFKTRSIARKINKDVRRLLTVVDHFKF